MEEKEVKEHSFLSKMTTKVRCVVSYPFLSSIDEICERLNRDAMTYALIVHDKDVKPNGEVKHKHLHIVMVGHTRKRLSTYINYLQEVCKKTTTDAIEVQPCNSFEWDLQYLIHQNDVDKYQYDVKNVRTNISTIDFDRLMNVEVIKQYSVYDILNVVQTSRTRTEVILRLGSHYMPYKTHVDAFIHDRHLGEMLNLDTASYEHKGY